MSEYTVGIHLLRRLRELGIEHVFGVPGDYVLTVIDRIEASPELTWVGSCNELNAAYSADGYARITGAGAFVMTAGVGDLGAAGGMGGSFAERVPVVMISGIPASEATAGRSGSTTAPATATSAPSGGCSTRSRSTRPWCPRWMPST